MARFFRDILLFVLFTLPLYVVLTILAGMLELPGQNLVDALGRSGHVLTRLRERAEHKEHEILVLGSSHAYRGFDPRIFAREGYRMFNLGSLSQSPLQTEVLLARYLHPDVPQLALFDVTPLVFSDRSVESTLDLIANDRLSMRMIGLGLQTRSIVVYNSMIQAAWSQITGVTDAYAEPIYHPPSGDRYIAGGYVEREHRPYKAQNRELLPWAPMQDQLEALQACIGQLRAAGSKVVLVNTPVMPTQQQSARQREEMRKYFSSLAPYYDLSTLLPADTSLFYDDDHMRQPGVERFNTELLRLLKADGHLDGVDRKLLP